MSDSELVGCPTCKGKCQLMGLGSIKEDCFTCHGVGWVEKAWSNPDYPNTLVNDPVKKKGRPKKEAYVS